MATKLKNLKVKKVDFVDEGANPDAHIKLFKRNDTGDKSDPAEKNSNKEAGVWKRLLGFIGKAAGMNQEEIDSAVDEIQKGDSESFNGKFNEVKNRKIADEIWDVCYALQSSLYSILNDGDLDSADTESAMKDSLDEFCAVVQDCITKWSDGKESYIVRKSDEMEEADLDVMKSAVSRLNEIISKASATEQESVANNENPKGEEEEMKIDKSKLTEAERAFLESIEKRCGEEETDPANAEGTAAASAEQAATNAEPTVTKSATQPAVSGTQDEPDNIYKGLHPAVKAELEGLKKFREEAESRELSEIAKRYEIIGKKEEELVPVLKRLRAAGGTAYTDMIAILDQAVDTVEKSGAFSEIGKSGHGNSSDGSAWAEADAKAVELMKSKAGLSKAQALDEVFMTNPELAEKCEKED